MFVHHCVVLLTQIVARRRESCFLQDPLGRVHYMRIGNSIFSHTYRLVLHDDGRGAARTIEFQAPGRESALYVAQRQCRDREAELIEDGRSLGRIQCVGSGGYWRLLPANTRRSQA